MLALFAVPFVYIAICAGMASILPPTDHGPKSADTSASAPQVSPAASQPTE